MIKPIAGILSIASLLSACGSDETITDCDGDQHFAKDMSVVYNLYTQEEMAFLSEYYVDSTSPLSLSVTSDLLRADNRIVDSFDLCDNYYAIAGNLHWEDQVIFAADFDEMMSHFFEEDISQTLSISLADATCTNDELFLSGLLFPVSRCGGAFSHNDRDYEWVMNRSLSEFQFASNLVEFRLKEDNVLTHYVRITDFTE